MKNMVSSLLNVVDNDYLDISLCRFYTVKITESNCTGAMNYRYSFNHLACGVVYYFESWDQYVRGLEGLEGTVGLIILLFGHLAYRVADYRVNMVVFLNLLK